jgi:phage-related protein
MMQGNDAETIGQAVAAQLNPVLINFLDRLQAQLTSTLQGGGTGKGASEMKEVTQTMASSKFRRGTKAVGGAFSKMGASSPQMMVLGAIMKGFQPILQMINPILQVITALIQQMAVQIIKPLMPIIMDIMSALMKFMPLFALIGKIIGDVLAPILKVLADILNWIVGILFGESPGLIPAFEIVAQLIKDIVRIVFESLMKPIEWTIAAITTIAQIIGGVLVVAFKSLEEIIRIVGNVIMMIANIIGNVLIVMFKSLAWVFYYVADAIVSIYNMVSNVVKGLTFGLINLGTQARPAPPSFDEGGIAMSAGIAKVDEGEWMIPGDTQQEMVWMLERIERNTRKKDSESVYLNG